MRYLIAAVLITITLAIPALGNHTPDHRPGGEVVARIYGCPAEDSCKVQYKVNVRGKGFWLVRRDPH